MRTASATSQMSRFDVVDGGPEAPLGTSPAELSERLARLGRLRESGLGQQTFELRTGKLLLPALRARDGQVEMDFRRGAVRAGRLFEDGHRFGGATLAHEDPAIGVGDGRDAIREVVSLLGRVL